MMINDKIFKAPELEKKENR